MNPLHPNLISPCLIINNILKELLQELYDSLLDAIEIYEIDLFKSFINNFLFEYDLDPKKVLEIMTGNSQNIFCYSGLIGFFYQHGIGCEIDKIKAFEVFSNACKNNQKLESNELIFDQKNEAIIFHYETKKLNEMILQYFYSSLLYGDIIDNSKYNYKLHIKKAEKGDPLSQYYIGNCYYYGYYGGKVTGDYKKAVEWYSKSSEGGNIEAMYTLGVCYNNGCGITKDEKKAFEFYLKSAERGYKRALKALGNCYLNGIGILKDKNKAFEWHLKAAKKGVDSSQYLIANYYNDGKHVSKNEEKEFYWARKAAINGSLDAQYKLAECYIDHFLNKNERKALKRYLKLASNNYPRAIYLVAKCYRDGVGTDKNLEEATKWITKYRSRVLPFDISITLDDFLNGSDVDASKIPTSFFKSKNK